MGRFFDITTFRCIHSIELYPLAASPYEYAFSWFFSYLVMCTAFNDLFPGFLSGSKNYSKGFLVFQA